MIHSLSLSLSPPHPLMPAGIVTYYFRISQVKK